MSRLAMNFIGFVRCGAVMIVGQVFVGLHVAVIGPGLGVALLALGPACPALLHWTVVIGIGMKFAVSMVSRKIAAIASAVLIVFHD